MKKINLFLSFIIFSLLFIPKTYASNASISVTANKSRVIVGDTVVVTVKISSSDNLGSWTFDVSASSNLTLVNSSFGGLYVRDVVDSATQKSKTYTYTFKANKSGSATVSVKNSTVYGYDEAKMSVSNGSKTFTLMTQQELEATYSKNNNLKSLSVEGYTLTPNFKSDILEYNLEVENGVESVKILATKEDNTASISGIGIVNLTEGANSFSVNVTAQNGSVKTYKINITVKELDPIIVSVDGNDFNVIRKIDAMPTASIYYEATTVKINDIEVPAYINTTTNITLVGLKDISGNTQLYVYDGNFSKYDELTFNQLSIKPLSMDESLLNFNYTKEKLEINGKTILAYKKEGSDFYLIYGLNLENGKSNLYKYDTLENTLQRYEQINIDNTLYLIIIAVLFIVLLISYIIFIILISRINKKNKKFLENTIVNMESLKEVN